MAPQNRRTESRNTPVCLSCGAVLHLCFPVESNPSGDLEWKRSLSSLWLWKEGNMYSIQGSAKGAKGDPSL